MVVTTADLCPESYDAGAAYGADGKPQAVVPRHFGSQEEKERLVEPGIRIAKLRRNQEMLLKCVAKKGIAKEHAKWSPVSVVGMLQEPDVRVNERKVEELTMEQREELVAADPHKVIELNDAGMIVVRDKMACVDNGGEVTEVRVGGSSVGAHGATGFEQVVSSDTNKPTSCSNVTWCELTHDLACLPYCSGRRCAVAPHPIHHHFYPHPPISSALQKV